MKLIDQKLIDQKLIQFAYGELSDREAERMAAIVAKRPDLQARLNTISATRTKLNLLQEIPEPQLSTERLRDAILGQGLRPVSAREASKPRASVAGWFAATIAVGGLAGIYVFHGSVSAPKSASSILARATGHQASLVANSGHKSLVETSAVGVEVDAKLVQGGFVPSKQRKRVGPRAGRHALRANAMSVIDAPTSLPDSLAVIHNLGDVKSGSAGNGAASLAGSAKPKNSHVPASKRGFMMIDGDQDAATGLPKAKEVADDSHVVLSS